MSGRCYYILNRSTHFHEKTIESLYRMSYITLNRIRCSDIARGQPACGCNNRRGKKTKKTSLKDRLCRRHAVDESRSLEPPNRTIIIFFAHLLLLLLREIRKCAGAGA